MAPIHFPARSRLLPLSWGLCTHTHALSLLAGHPFPLPFLVTFPLIVSLFTCTISARRISGLLSLCPFHFTGTHPIISWTPYLTISLWRHHPFTLTIASVCDSVPPYPYLTTSPWLILLPAYLCTTTYGLVCAHFPYVYKPYVPWLYSLTWIYLVLYSYLVHNHL
jgi:hypothetical protein